MARIHSFESFGTVDGPGIRFVVFLQGCPMRCKYCHNPDTWDVVAGRELTAEEVCAEALKYRSYFTGGGGVTVSGGEPLLQIDFLIELFALLKARGVHTCLDTSGICFRKDDYRYLRLAELCDLVLLDLKHSGEAEHVSLTGRSGEAPRAFATFLSERGTPVWIRHVLVPGVTDGEDQLIQLRKFLDTLSTVEKVEVLPYHSLGVEKYRAMGIPYPLEGVLPPEREIIERAKRILRAGKYA
jgi:pyruvate formate lyase activating enzyme